MRELRLAGIHDDGENLVLESADGTTYLLPIDQNLRQSIARARRISPLRGGKGSSFGPRDIQTRFRQGATVEEIAAESGWEPERVRRYEWPIVAERANIIRLARTVLVKPSPGQTQPAQSLDQMIEAVSQRYHFFDSPMDWSTWQQESGQWTVSLDLALPEEAQKALPQAVMFPARWTFNPANQSIYASNESAYFLMGRDQASGQAQNQQSPSRQEAAEEQAKKEEPQPAPSAPASQLPSLPANQPAAAKDQPSELAARPGVRSFDQASERKLADLLERARRTSRNQPEGRDEQAPGQDETLELDSAPLGQDSDQLPAEDQPDQDPQLQGQASDSLGQSASPTQLGTPTQLGQQVEAPAGAEPAQSAASAQLGEATELPTAASPAEAAEPTTPATPAAPATPSAPATPATPAAPVNQSAASPQAEAASAPQAPAASDQPEQARSTASAEGQEQEESKPAQPKPSRGKRTSVPSWDDIIFGNQRR